MEQNNSYIILVIFKPLYILVSPPIQFQQYFHTRVTMGSKPSYPLSLFLLISLNLFLKSNAGELVTYWGQDGREGSLTDTCNSGLYQIVNIAFLSTFGSGRQPQINLAGHCEPASCQGVGTGIKNCQRRNIKVLLSIGGDDSKHTYSLSSADDATKVADYIWDHFLGGQSNSRPFGDAVLDGVDFDIEGGGGDPHYAALARRLKDRAGGSSRKFYLAAAPQCPFQYNNILHEALNTGLFDYVWIQFYNNPGCEFNSNNPSSFRSAWNQWTRSINAGKFFVGLPAAPAAAGSGFVPSQAVINQLLPIVRSPKYGGVMLWNRYFDVQTGYGRKIKGSV